MIYVYDTLLVIKEDVVVKNENKELSSRFDMKDIGLVKWLIGI